MSRMNSFLRRILLLLALTLSIGAMADEPSSQRLKVGLVLGGGGAKGAAEVGVLKVIEEVGIPIDYIAGTSIGSISGGLYAMDIRSAKLDSLFLNQNWLELFAGNVREFLGEVTDHKHFNELSIPFRCVAVDFKTQEEIIMDSCEIELAMRASMAIPGAFKPVRWKGHTLVDGGMMNNLPVDVVKAMGADVVIAIDLQQEQHEGRDFSLKETFGIGGILDWAVSRPDWKKNKANREAADVYICPDLDKYSVSSFGENSIDTMIELGEQAGQAAKEELLRLKEMVFK